jgi:hypothetical protein
MCNYSQYIEDKGFEKGRREGRREVMIYFISMLMKNLKISSSEAMEMLDITEEERQMYLED